MLGVRHHDPHSVLGAHPVTIEGRSAIVVRAFDLVANHAACVLEGIDQAFDLTRFEDGYFEGAFAIDKPELPFRYRLRFGGYFGEWWESEDPYAFVPTIGELDLHLFNEGRHHRLYEALGAHPHEMDGVVGTRFAVWAPNAERVSLTGNFNNWDGRRHPMRLMGLYGVWELFVPRLGEGTLYKLEIRTRAGNLLEKIDPFGFSFELRPSNAARVVALDGYQWGDEAWLEKRAVTKWTEAPVNIYEVHLGSWQRDADSEHGFLNYRELAVKLAEYCHDMSYTHVELLPVAEHPFDGSWGYQVTGYYAPTSRHGTPHDFMAFVDHMHREGIGVLVDWVPAHFPRDAWALGRFDGTALYEHEDPRQGEHRDWGTFIFNYGRPEVHNFLEANALFWMDAYHVDGIRVDAVASMLYLDYSRDAGQWVPNKYGGRENLEALEFLKNTNMLVHEYFPGVVTVAEESTSWPMVSRPVYLGGLGFDFKWNMGWMNDFLHYVQLDPFFRKYHLNNLTFAMMYAYSENFVLVLSHDEVVHGKRSMLNKMPGDDWQRFANLRVALAYMLTHPGKKLTFMGTEIGQWQEWWEKESLHWGLLDFDLHRQFHEFIKTLNAIYLAHPALWQVDYSWDGFQWIDCHDAENSIISYIRRAKDKDRYLVCVFNFTPVGRKGYRIGVPRDGFYKELLNSDSEGFGGSNMGNMGGLTAEAYPSHGHL
ncbi:MAG: 1,4-alpha-glucan branching protein GlgB, partial [Armatimonadetes bacterium]|nr:1,4-alpha-glucan branching protein GlgB [Armatimonadota bacterium]